MIISIVNQKGGVGKSSTALSVFDGLKLLNKKCLFIDLDSQCNSTYTLSVMDAELTSYNLFNNGDINNVIKHTARGDVIPASKMLATVENNLANIKNRHSILLKSIKQLKTDYDYIIIDTPPALNILTINALISSDEIIIPALPDIYSLQGIKNLADTINTVKEISLSDIVIKGILMSKFTNRTVLNREVLDMANTLADNIGTKVFNAKIRESVVVKEAQISKKSIYEYAPKSKVTMDYIDFLYELIGERIVINGKK